MFTNLIQDIKSKISFNEQDILLFKTFWKTQKLKKNQYLVQIGEICRHDSYVVKGCLKISYFDHRTGNENILSFAMENWWATDLESFLKQKKATFNIQAIEPCELLQLDLPSFYNLLEHIPALERYFRIILENHLSALQWRIITSNSMTAEEKYQDFITRYPAINQRVPQYLIASYLGITPEFLSRIRSKK